MPNSQELYHFTHTSSEIETVGDLLAYSNSPAYIYNQYPERFLSIIGEDGLTNRQRIEASYLKAEDKIYKGAAWNKLRLLTGTLLYLEYDMVNHPSFLTEGIEVVSNDEPAFKAARLAEIEADKGYLSVNNPVKGQLIKGGSQEFQPEVTVWIWCRALSDNNNAEELKGQFFDLTPFIENAATSMSKNGGNFQIKLPPLTCVQDDKKKWVLTNNSIDQYVNENETSLQGAGYVAQSTMFTPGSEGEPVRTQMLFHNIISPNDLVFIRFETLEMEKEQRYEDAQEFFISKKNIAGRLYDMIGLVDNNLQSVNPINNDVSIIINGRDLTKLFLDDGTYFYALENSQGILKFAGQSTQKNAQMSRIFADGALNFIGLYQFTSIEYILKFIIQQLSNIKIVPNDLFESYGDRRNKIFVEKGKDGIDNKKRKELMDQAVTHIKSLRQKNKLRISDDSKELEKTDEIFFRMVRFLQKIRIDYNRELNEFHKTQSWKSFKWEGETVEDNTLPNYFSENLLGDNVDTEIWAFMNVVDRYIDAGILKKIYEEQTAPGIWQLVKLVIDKSVANRRLADSSFSTANGSLINFIRSAIQEPLAEIFFDTYGDQFHLIVRKPPYDQNSLISLIEGKCSTEDGVPGIPPAIVNIRQEDVIRETLSYDDSNVYSWYHFFSRNSLLGDAQNYSLSYLPALYFPEYAEVFGSKPFQQSHNYLPYIPLKSSADLDVYERQSIEDLRYVVNSNQYLPFTRKGSITLNRDRRLKIGNIFRYESTGEIGFITGVQHTFQISESSIEAITVINVERMMIEQLIYGTYMNSDSGEPLFVSYFNIIPSSPDSLVFIKRKVTKTETRTVKKKSATNNTQAVNTNSNPLIPTYSGFFSTGFAEGIQVSDKINTGTELLRSFDKFPTYKPIFLTFINLANKAGYKVHITSAVRDHNAQKSMRNSHKAKGTSKHEYGLAMDINLISMKTGEWYRQPDSEEKWRSTGVPQIAIGLGLQWGDKRNKGVFYKDGNPEGNVDRCHFEIALANNPLEKLAEVGDEWEEITETTTTMEIDREGIFQNMKVNKAVFNFFLKKRQHEESLRTVTSRLVYDNGGALLDDVQVIGKKKIN